MPHHAFPLFSLPYLPLKKVLNNFGVHAILYLSMCSLRSKRIAVSYRGPSKNVKLTLHFGYKHCLSLATNTFCMEEGLSTYWLLSVENRSEFSSVDRNLATVRIGNFCKIPVEKGRLGLSTYWDDCMVGITEIGDYAREVFNQDIYEVMLGEKLPEDVYERAAEYVTKSQETIHSLRCDFKPEIDNDLDFILENFKYTEILALDVNPSPEYCPAKFPNFNVDHLHILYSFWVKQEHLLTMNCKYIILQESELSSNDFNVFLKHFMNGGCSQLKEFSVDVKTPIDYEVVLNDVEFEERARDVERVYVDEEEHHHTLRGGLDIKRPSDDAKVTIKNFSKHFLMIVWPDFVGNSY
ncbi:hypothetical protein GCK72_006986 [Caenorhabditis remanei]|uniref:Sdz-33 F-box domain-containing protein n=1 Tax=Caenorhabditis remanei TaxID=31234 RepID=A0A6A5HGT6_CAERE|nr:hypothetical protein GCK72_006986 [Caenorhabditis remanei]KAF1767028.1 hypothetical protein GCK72_006986 [Caenorhabditis remanei]